MKADRAEVVWENQKKHWLVRIQVGGEVIRRPVDRKGPARDASEDAIRTVALRTAQEDGYELEPDQVVIRRE